MTDWTRLTDASRLDDHYGPAVQGALDKVAPRVTPLYRQWIEASRFCVLSTVGPEGTDATPRGDDGPVVRIHDEGTLLLPDWRGNNRLDSLRNILRDPRASLMFLVPGCDNVVRANGRASLTADADLRASFAKGDRQPATVIVFEIDELYFQCAKALMRSRLWTSPDQRDAVPTAGQFLREAREGFDAEAYDAGYPAHAAPRMW